MAPVQIERAMGPSIPHAPGMSSGRRGNCRRDGVVSGRGRRARGLRHVLVLALAELLDRLRAEGRDVVGLAAGDEALVHVDLLVDPGAARVAHVGLQRRPRRDRAALDDAGLDQDPGPVADRGDRLVRRGERGREPDGVLVGAQEVAVGHAAGDQQAVVVVGADVRDLAVDLELLGVVQVVEALDLALFEADELGRRAGLLERLAGLDELHLLDAVGGEDRDLLAVQLAWHLGSPSFRVRCLVATAGPARVKRARTAAGAPIRPARAVGSVTPTQSNRSKETTWRPSGPPPRGSWPTTTPRPASRSSSCSRRPTGWRSRP